MSKEPKKTQGMRLAMRHEGDFWVAYIAQLHTMDKAIEIGRIAFGAVNRNEKRRADFMAMMQGVLEDAAFAVGIDVAGWNPPQDAPESERGGHA